VSLAWLPTAERIGSAWTGGTYLTTVPWRFVAHTTEVVPSSLVGAKAMAARHPYPPHLWAWPARRWLAQTVPLDRSAAALVQPASAPAQRTNKARAIQVEIIGNAGETPRWSTETWEWLGEFVLAPVVAAGYPIDLANVADLDPYPQAYGEDGSARMTWAEWLAFDGVCAHQNVPENEHWDIGDGRLDLMAAAARRTLNLQEDDLDMDVTELKQAVREVLNEGTGQGQVSWARTSKSTLANAQAAVQNTKVLIGMLSNPAGLAAALAPLLPDHDVTAEHLETALRTLLDGATIDLADAGEG
jgi:hypothetical protein